MVQRWDSNGSAWFACRHWLVIAEDGHMVTARQEPRLVLVSLTLEGRDVCLNGPDMEELRFPVRQSSNRIIDCRFYIWVSFWLTVFFD